VERFPYLLHKDFPEIILAAWFWLYYIILPVVDDFQQ